jgi:hypothetical protein
MNARQAVLAATLGLGMSCASAGSLTTYDLVLTLETVSNAPRCAFASNFNYGCLAVGETFRGRFSVDSDILTTDGLNTTAAIYDLYLPFGKEVWSTGPDNTVLVNFWNGEALAPPAAAPGFVIENGQVVDIAGGFIGPGDGIWIDMYKPTSRPRNRFSTGDAQGTWAIGSLSVVTPVPEAETMIMWMGGMLLIGLTLWRGKRQSNNRYLSSGTATAAHMHPPG